MPLNKSTDKYVSEVVYKIADQVLKKLKAINKTLVRQKRSAKYLIR